MAHLTAGKKTPSMCLERRYACAMFQQYGGVQLLLRYEAHLDHMSNGGSDNVHRWERTIELSLDECLTIWSQCQDMLLRNTGDWHKQTACMPFGDAIRDRLCYPIPYIFVKHTLNVQLSCLGIVISTFCLDQGGYAWQRKTLTRETSENPEPQFEDRFGHLETKLYYVDPHMYKSLIQRKKLAIPKDNEEMSRIVEALYCVNINLRAERALTQDARCDADGVPIFSEIDLSKQPLWISLMFPIVVNIHPTQFMQCYYSACKSDLVVREQLHIIV